MQLDSLNIEFDPNSEYQDDKRPKLYHISACSKETEKWCPFCDALVKRKEAPGRKIHDYRMSPVTGDKHVYIVELFSQRYCCTNPDCARSFTAGILPRNFTHTDNFEEYVIYEMLTNEKASFSKIGRDIKMSHTKVSNIFTDYAKKLNLHFVPHRNLNYMYLHEFSYQNEKRYYLVKVTHRFEANLVAFFGYEDCDKELIDYFRFHWKDQEESKHFLTLYTENGEHLSELLKPYVRFIWVVPSRLQIDKELEPYAVDENDYTYLPAVDKIEELKNIMKIKDDEGAVQRWWDEIAENEKRKKLKRLLTPLWDMLCENKHYLYLYRNFQTDFTPLNDDINLYNAQRLPFEKMCVRLMYRDQGEHILINEDLRDCLQHDEKKDIFYRDTVLTAEEIAQIEREKWEKEMDEFKKKMDEFTHVFEESGNPFIDDSSY